MRFYHFFRVKPLTTAPLYGLMRPVARIAQSVEQGIENPRVLGSIPSPGTTTFRSRRLIFPRSKVDVKRGRSSSHADFTILYCLMVDLPESSEHVEIMLRAFLFLLR